MIRFDNLSKSFWIRDKQKVVIDNLNLDLPTGKSLALLGRNGAGKSTLLKIISGALKPTTGQVLSDGSISWPVGLSAAFHPEMTGAQNVRFVARIYGVDTAQLVDFVHHFSEIGDHFYMPFKTYSSGMRARVSFGAVMGIRFDTYLVDEVTSVGDASFKKKSKAVFLDRVKTASAIMVSHSMTDVRAFCDAAIVLSDGKVRYFEDIEEGIELHHHLMQAG